MLRDRKELEEELIEVINKIKLSKKHNRAIVNSITEKLNDEYGLDCMELIKNPQGLSEIDSLQLCLVADVISVVAGEPKVSPLNFFTENEIKEAKKAYEPEPEISLPITLDNVLSIDNENYLTIIDISYLNKLYHSGIIIYDYETQRSPKFKRSATNTIPVPDVNAASVQEIAQHYLNGTYLPDTITLNVYSEEVEALSYNPKTKQLIINEGATVSILDGFHRLQAAVRALDKEPGLKLTLQLAIKSYDTPKAKKYFGQINTINIVKKERLQELKAERYADDVVNDLKIKSDLKGKIASAPQISTVANQLTTHSILADTIDEVFKPQSKLEARELANYLTEFFDYLLGYFPDEFVNNQDKFRKESYINNWNIFVGYVVLAKKMQENNVPLSKLKYIVSSIDFSKDNSEIAQIFESSRDAKRARKKIKEYFEKLDIDNLVAV
jgi:hypothetical protein